MHSARNGDLATCPLDPNRYYDDTSLLGWRRREVRCPFLSPQSRLVAKFLAGIPGQRNNVTPCPKDCAGVVPLFRACGSGVWTAVDSLFQGRLHSERLHLFRLGCGPLTRNRPRTRCEPVECRWTFGEAHVWTCCCGSVAGQLDTAGRPRSRGWAFSFQWATDFRDSVRRKPAKKPGPLQRLPLIRAGPLRGHHPQRLVSCECSPLAARPLISDSLVSGYASCRWRRPAWGASLCWLDQMEELLHPLLRHVVQSFW